MASEPHSAFDVSNGLWNECEIAFQFINSGVREVLCGAKDAPRPLPRHHEPGWWRALAWQASLTRLVAPGDFQAVFSAARSLLEITIDTVLLQYETDGPAIQADWEESAKYKHANAIARYFASSQKPPRSAQFAISYAQREGARIEAARTQRGWAKSSGATLHPNRWTSRSLDVDAQRADAFEPGLNLERTYETKYREMCWYVHGSGAVGMRGIPAEDFPALGGLMFRTCALLAVQHAKLLLKYSGLWAVPYRDGAWADHFRRLHDMQVLTTHAAVVGPDEE